jgi:hypothetical protein
MLHYDNKCLCCFRCRHSARHQYLGFGSISSVGPCWLTLEIIYYSLWGLDMDLDNENRQYPRSVIKWPVTIKTSQETISAQMRDVSPSGAFIYCDRPMTPKHVFFLSIHINSSTVSLSSMAESVWSTHDGMGVRFHLDRPEQGQLLSKFILDA